MTHGSLFSGIGGFDLAAAWCGWDNVFQCEIDTFCQRVLKYHFPNTELYGDIKTTDFTKYRGTIDVLSGGFPCQPFSVAGKRKGADDDRYLFPQMLRVINEVRPRWVVGENVGGIVSMVQPGSETPVESQASLFETDDEKTILAQEYVIETICAGLENIGYSVQPVVIPACAVGAPHKRDRVWFIAHDSNTRYENLQQEWEDGISFTQTTPNANSNDAERCGYGKIEQTEGERQYKKQERGIRQNSERVGCKRVIANTTSKRLERTVNCGKQEAKKNFDNVRSDITRFSKKQSSANSTSDRSQEGTKVRASTISRKVVGFNRFPTQSPVCGRDDGLPCKLDFASVFEGIEFPRKGKSFPRWRKESIKAYGNAIVPQVAYQIFKTINVINL
jgi:DNA-methyltransferase (dcm)